MDKTVQRYRWPIILAALAIISWAVAQAFPTDTLTQIRCDLFGNQASCNDMSFHQLFSITALCLALGAVILFAILAASQKRDSSGP
jgi:hypothetical protein